MAAALALMAPLAAEAFGQPRLEGILFAFSAVLLFSGVMGLLWLSTIPPTSALVAIMFGQRWLTMLLGVAFFSHQVGGFLGVWLGGVLFERTGSYDVIWWGTILLGLASAAINLPIVEQPVARPAAVAA